MTPLPEGFTKEKFDEILGVRGITEEVAYDATRNESAFFRYQQGDLEAVLKADSSIEARGRGAIEAVEARVNRSAGIVMRRWPVPGADQCITAEIRPDKHIWSGAIPTVHEHGKMSKYERRQHVRSSKTTAEMVYEGMTPDEYECWTRWAEVDQVVKIDEATFGADHFRADTDDRHLHVKVAKYLFAANPTKVIVEPGTPHSHTDFFRTHDGREYPDDSLSEQQVARMFDRIGWHEWYKHNEVVHVSTFEKALRKNYGVDPDADEDLSGITYERYRRVVGPVKSADDAAIGRTSKGQFKFRRPVAGLPNDPVFDRADEHGRLVTSLSETAYIRLRPHDAGLHEHYIVVKDDEDALAKRLSIMPRSLRRLAHAKRVFFALEGCLKEAALVSAGEVTFSCPSISLWDAPELEEFATEHLQGKRVYVVCDSDWAREEDDSVIRQVISARERLRFFGIDAEAAAPPSPCEAGCTDAKHLEDNKHGVDDHLGPCTPGRAKDKVEDLIVIVREARSGYAEWLAKHPRPGKRNRIDGVTRDAVVLQWIAVHAGIDGTTSVASETIAKALMTPLDAPTFETAKRTVDRAIQSLIDHGAVEEVVPRSENVQWHFRKEYKEWVAHLRVIDELQVQTALVPIGKMP